MTQEPKNKEAWLRRLKATSIPSFNASIQALSSLKNYTSAHASELARSILKDPNLTASVLKLANSVHFNSYGRQIRTISRAIMLLGYQSIKEVCATCLLLEQFLKENSSNNLKALLARAFHSAIQAKQIAILQGQKNTEEIFISALLLNLGEIFIYSMSDVSEEMRQELEDAYPLTNGKERDIIGCYYTDLTMGLCSSWNIAPMIGEMLGGKYSETSPVRSILLGTSFASSCETEGIDIAVKSHIKSITRYTGKAPEEITEDLDEACEETRKSLTPFGVALDVKTPEEPEEELPQQEFEVVIDKNLQFEIIQELSAAVQEKIDINMVLQLLLEGIQRGGGFSCSLVALLNPDRSRIQAKHAIEQAGNNSRDNFNFKCYQEIPEIQQKVMSNRKVLLQSELRPQGDTVNQIKKRTACEDSIWGPLVVENKVIGCFYANNGVNGPLITQEQQEAFQFFIFQAGFILSKIR